MAFDGLFIHSLLQDLSPTLVGGKLTKIYQPFEQDLVLNFRKDRKNQRFLLMLKIHAFILQMIQLQILTLLLLLLWFCGNI